jgi:hypothetical protein
MNQGGKPGTQLAGGVGGGNGFFADPGSLGQGGDGRSTISGDGQGGGGGGGGLYGGGGGFDNDSPGAGGGGGGSGLATAGAQLETGVCSGNGSISVSPSNDFSLGKAKQNKKKGIALLEVDVPNAGQLVGTGKGVKKAAAGAVIAKTVEAPGVVKLKIRVKGKKQRQLEKTGKVKVLVDVTYTPTGGDPSIQPRKLMLRKSA